MVPLLPDASVDLILCDPPYVLARPDDPAADTALLAQFRRVLRLPAPCLLWATAGRLARARAALAAHWAYVARLDWGPEPLVLATDWAVLAEGALRLDLDDDPLPADRLHHPAEKPPALLRALIAALCPPGGTVLDPFAGSAGTALAALATGRRAIAIECNPGYHSVCRERIEGTTHGSD